MSGVLHPALAALLADPRLALRPPKPNVTLDQFRAAANAFMARAPLPAVHGSTDHLIERPAGSLRVRLIRPNDAAGLPVVLFFHGGGFVLGSLASHEAMARSLALETQAVVAVVDYRLAPEHPYPAALDDAVAAFGWIEDNAQLLGVDSTRVAVAGDSAGGQLAAALVSRIGDQTKLRHLALLYPLLDPNRSSTSARTMADDYMLTGEFIEWAWHCYGRGRGDPLVNVFEAELGGFPPASILTAEFDPLRDEGLAFANCLRKAGREVESRCFPRMIHGFAGLSHVVPQSASEAMEWIGRRVGAALAN